MDPDAVSHDNEYKDFFSKDTHNFLNFLRS